MERVILIAVAGCASCQGFVRYSIVEHVGWIGIALAALLIWLGYLAQQNGG